MNTMNNDAVVMKISSGLPGIRILKAYDMEHKFDDHIHSDYCIGCITRGERSFITNEKNYHLQRNDLYICNPEEVHSCSVKGRRPHSYTAMCFPESYVSEAGNSAYEEDVSLWRFCNHIQAGSGLEDMFKTLCNLLASPASILEKENAFYSFLETLITRHGTGVKVIPQPEEPSVLKRVLMIKRYIRENCMMNFSLQNLSEYFQLSPFYINRSFKKLVGLSLHRYHLQVRIEQSCKLLAEGCSITQAAVDSGFTDQSHYRRFFKKFYGVTPGKYVLYNRKNSDTLTQF